MLLCHYLTGHAFVIFVRKKLVVLLFDLSLLLIISEKKQMVGLGIGAASMRSGERALLRVGWELGYGEEGSFSFPNVPPSADLLYEVELIGFDEVKEVGHYFRSWSCPFIFPAIYMSCELEFKICKHFFN